MDIKISTLCENTASGPGLAEFGLSMLVEAGGQRILMDTGRSFVAVHNAQLMGIDLASVTGIVISHGHHDHTGGLLDILRRTRRKEVIAHPDIFSPKYARNQNEKKERYVGISFNRRALEAAGARFRLSREPVRITDRIMTLGEVPMESDYEHIESNLYVKQGRALLPDPLADDLAMVIDADYGLVVVSGCAHRGIINTVRRAQALTGKKKVYAVIGGTHLMLAGDDRIGRTAGELLAMGVEKLCVSHCTGFHAAAQLEAAFGKRFIHNNAGTVLKLP